MMGRKGMKNVFWISVLIGMQMSILTACKPYRAGSKTDTTDASYVDWMLKHERGPCFGQCPVYEFYVLKDHTGLIEVKANLLEPGWYAASLDPEALHAILDGIESPAWWNEDLSDEPVIADLPSFVLYDKHQDGLRSYASQGRMSDAQGKIFEMIGHLVTESRWQPTTLRPADPELPQPTALIVLLQDGVEVQQWMKKYTAFGIKLKQRLNPDAQYYVVTKDPGMGASNDFYQHIRQDDEVIEARWEKPSSPQE